MSVWPYEWQGGMAGQWSIDGERFPFRVDYVDGDGSLIIVAHGWRAKRRQFVSIRPHCAELDLTDDATRGAILGMIRDAAGEPRLSTTCVNGWRMTVGYGNWDPMRDELGMPRTYDTEGELLVAACEVVLS